MDHDRALTPAAQITVLDAGGQYCHLIARKVRELGVFANVRPSETSAAELAADPAIKGFIISGGPNSVYDPGSPTVDPELFRLGAPVFGICYGQQLMAHLLGGTVQRGKKGEYGFATLELAGDGDPIFAGVRGGQQVWMSHRDVVSEVPGGFSVLGRTATCAVAAMSEPARRLYAVQFHPEVVHTAQGREILSNFLFSICGCQKDWDPRHRVSAIESQIRDIAEDRNIFFFVSGGVDSTVAYTLCLRALGAERVCGVYVDTGLMRQGETEFVKRNFDTLGAGTLSVECADEQFLTPLAGVVDPEQKRNIIGEEFVRVQERIIESRHLLDGHWMMGQGTIYPDTIESGGTEKAAVIKTHHNRVPGIQKLLSEGRIVEPLSSFYKDEVREIGRELGLSPELLDRHPFPGPGLAIRCLCSGAEQPVREIAEGFIIPVHSVGVQGDCRSYAPVLAISSLSQQRATELINTLDGINRVVGVVGNTAEIRTMRVRPASLSRERLNRLRVADAIVRRLSHESGFDREVWQFPVVLIPFGTETAPDSVVLRPIHSVDGMTAASIPMPQDLLDRTCRELLAVPGLSAVLYDLTHKPPATIEWE